MSAAGNLGVYGLALVAVMAVARYAGGAVDPVGLATVEPEAGAHGEMTETTTGEAGGHGGAAAATEAGLPGLARAEGGYRLEPEATRVTAGTRTPYRFRIVTDDGPVTEFDVEHDRRMHLIVVRRDMVGFRHQHPTMAPDGTWTTTLDLDDPGAYRVFADFVVGGEKHTLGVDLFVPGDFRPDPLPEVDPVAEVPDGYTVELAGDAVEGATSELAFTVRRDGQVVDDLSPYLGARGHLVALRDGDLAFLHVHADEDRLDFAATFPTADPYRLFLQFRHDGHVRTAAFTIVAQEAGR